MSELNTELVAQIDKNARALSAELERLRTGALRLAEKHDVFKDAVASIDKSGKVLAALAGQIEMLGNAVRGLDPATVNKAISDVRDSVQGAATQVQELRTVLLSMGEEYRAGVARTEASLRELSSEVRGLDEHLAASSNEVLASVRLTGDALEGGVRDLRERLTVQLESAMAEQKAQSQALESRMELSEVSQRQLIAELTDLVLERTDRLRAIQALAVGGLIVLGLVLAAVLLK